MKTKLIIGILVLVLLAITFFMAKDLFFKSNKDQKNPYALDFGDLRKTDTSLLSHVEVDHINPGLEKISGIAIDDKDNIYITGSKTLKIYDKNKNLIKEFNTVLPVRCLTVSPEGNIYLGAQDHVEIWNSQGEQIQKWETLNPQVFITSIALNEESVFVADAGNKIVYHYTHAGELLNTIGAKDTINNTQGFVIPSPYFDLLTGRMGELWVVNPGLHQLESYQTNGHLISSWNKTSMQVDGFSGCCNPTHIAMLSNGYFVTSEKSIERVKIHLPNGDFKSIVAGPEQFIKGTRGLDLAVDSEDRIYVLDPENKRIRIFTTKN